MSPSNKDKVKEYLQKITEFCPEIIQNMNSSSDGRDEIKTGDMLHQLYDLVIELEHQGRSYTGGPKLAKIL